jgi:anti-sigma regulatory factor (Ser/Thr protein kinase)
MNLDLHDQNLSQIARAAVNQVEFLIREKSIDIINNVADDITVVIDPAITERVFINLLTNAIKYSPANGQIILETEAISKERIKVSITDSGDGIPADKLDKVFEKFQQLNPQQSGKTRSTGLGLTFCKMAVESHGGSIGVESSIGKGAKFWFTMETSSRITASIEIPETYQTTKLKLSDYDKESLQPYIQQFENLEIYEISDLRQALMRIDTEDNPELNLWKEKIQKAIYTNNEEKYHQLLKP